jgi:hypothetical protein
MIRTTIPSADIGLLRALILLLCWVGILVRTAAGVSAQTATFVPVGSIPGPADLVRVDGRYAYVAAGKTLTVVDISNPAAPMRTGAYTFPEKIWGFRVVGSSVYVADDFFGLGILDVSNAAAPTLRGSMKTPGQAKNVAVFGTKAVVADHMSGVDFIDVSNPAKPASLGSFFLEGYARDVVAAGSLAYAVDAPAGLYVFDLSKPGPLDAVSSQQSAAAPGSVVVSDVTTQGPKVAVLVGAGSLQVYDLSNPAAPPVKAATYRTPGGRPQRVALKGAQAYVADGPAGLQLVDLSAPSMPRLVGTYKTANPARDVAVADSLVFVVAGPLPQGNLSSGGGEVLILRQTP